MSAKRKRKARQNGETITKAHKAVRMAKDGKNPSKANKEARANAKWESVKPRDIMPITHEKLFSMKSPKKKHEPMSEMEKHKDHWNWTVFTSGKFPITELMEKPIKYTRA